MVSPECCRACPRRETEAPGAGGASGRPWLRAGQAGVPGPRVDSCWPGWEWGQEGRARLTFYELEPAAESRAGPPGCVPTWEGHGEPYPGWFPSQFGGFSQKPMVRGRVTAWWVSRTPSLGRPFSVGPGVGVGEVLGVTLSGKVTQGQFHHCHLHSLDGARLPVVGVRGQIVAGCGARTPSSGSPHLTAGSVAFCLQDSLRTGVCHPEDEATNSHRAAEWGRRGRQGTLVTARRVLSPSWCLSLETSSVLLSGSRLGATGGCKQCQDPGHVSCCLPRARPAEGPCWGPGSRLGLWEGLPTGRGAGSP